VGGRAYKGWKAKARVLPTPTLVRPDLPRGQGGRVRQTKLVFRRCIREVMGIGSDEVTGVLITIYALRYL
jgi:hypothetical protein